MSCKAALAYSTLRRMYCINWLDQSSHQRYAVSAATCPKSEPPKCTLLRFWPCSIAARNMGFSAITIECLRPLKLNDLLGDVRVMVFMEAADDTDAAGVNTSPGKIKPL